MSNNPPPDADAPATAPGAPQEMTFQELVIKVQDEVAKLVGGYLRQMTPGYQGQLLMYVATRQLAHAIFMNAALVTRSAEVERSITGLCDALQSWLIKDIEAEDTPRILRALEALRSRGTPQLLSETEVRAFPTWLGATLATVWRMAYGELGPRVTLEKNLPPELSRPRR